MQTDVIETQATKGQLWTGRILTGLTAAFLFLDAAMKLIKPEPVVTAFAQTGWPIDVCVPIGITLLVCTVLYLIPRTAVIGALLLTAYLGGAVAVNVRIHTPLFTNCCSRCTLALRYGRGCCCACRVCGGSCGLIRTAAFLK